MATGRARSNAFSAGSGFQGFHVLSLPPNTRPSSGGSAAAMEPAGLEQILRELLLPDTERIRRVRDGGGVGGDRTGTNGRRWWESPDSDPGTPPRPPSSSRPLFVTPPPCPPSATCSPRRSILR